MQVAHAYQLLRSTLGTAHRDGLIAANPCTIRGAGTVKPVERKPQFVVLPDGKPAAGAYVALAAWTRPCWS